MDTLILIIGVVGLSISGWVLRGYFVNVSPTSPSGQKPTLESETDQTKPVADLPTTNYVSLEDHQQVLQRLEELEKAGLPPKIDQNGSIHSNTVPILAPEADRGEADTELAINDNVINEEDLNSEKWKEIIALQEAYQKERLKEKEINYEQEQTLFDISQGYDGSMLDLATDSVTFGDEENEQRLLDNQYEIGEELDAYQERMSQFATLTKEMLIMRLESADALLREQQEKYQASLLNIIASLIEKVPGDINLKNIAQSSLDATSTDLANADGETNRENFQKMFYKSFGQ